MLDVKSTNKGMLVPRVTTAQRDAIATPAHGLLVFDTEVNSFFFHDGNLWINLSAPPQGGESGIWTKNESLIYSANSKNKVGIGTTTPLSKLEVVGDNTIGVDDPLFEVKNTEGTTVFAVYPEGVRVYLPEAQKRGSNKGGFAVEFEANKREVTPTTPIFHTVWLQYNC